MRPNVLATFTVIFVIFFFSTAAVWGDKKAIVLSASNTVKCKRRQKKMKILLTLYKQRKIDEKQTNKFASIRSNAFAYV